MSRSIALATLLALGSYTAGASAQSVDGAQLASLTEGVGAIDDGAIGTEDGYADDEYADEYDGEDYDQDMEYCGGGDMSLVDEAWEEMEFGDRRRAYELLVSSLRHGEIDSWERGRALSILAELQLRRGEPGRAIVNFRRAERMEPGVTDVSRVALATALFRRGERNKARTEARTARAELCSDQYAVAGCYAANLILAETERGASERLAAADAAATLRRTNPDLAHTLDEVDARVAGS